MREKGGKVGKNNKKKEENGKKKRSKTRKLNPKIRISDFLAPKIEFSIFSHFTPKFFLFPPPKSPKFWL